MANLSQSKLEELQYYRDAPNLSQSFLKAVLANEKPKQGNLGMVMGSYVDTYITCNGIIDDLYYVDDTILTDSQYKIINLIVEKGSWDKKTIQSAINEIGYYNNRHKDNVDEDKRVDEFLKLEYLYTALASGKKFVSSKIVEEAKVIANTILSHPKSARFFEADYQVPLYWEKDGLLFKGLADMISDTFIADLKITDSPLRDWKFIARRFRYDFQMSFYKYGLKQEEDFPAYIVVYSTADRLVDVFKFTDLDLHIGRYGASRNKNNIIVGNDVFRETDVIHGWEDAIAVYKLAKEMNLPDYNVQYNNLINPLNIWL
jgi:hypothetical protein